VRADPHLRPDRGRQRLEQTGDEPAPALPWVQADQRPGEQLNRAWLRHTEVHPAHAQVRHLASQDDRTRVDGGQPGSPALIEQRRGDPGSTDGAAVNQLADVSASHRLPSGARIRRALGQRKVRADAGQFTHPDHRCAPPRLRSASHTHPHRPVLAVILS